MPIINARGKLTFLRAHDVGSGWGPESDPLDAEAIIRLDSAQGKAFGFQLRANDDRVAHQAMLDLLRDAFNNDWTVSIDYDIEDESLTNGLIIRVALVKP